MRRSVWRMPDLVRLLAAGTASSFGTMMSAMAVPWLMIEVLEASDAAVAGLATLRLMPALVLSALAGAWVDRVRRRPLLIGADLGRAGLSLAIPVLYLTEHLDALVFTLVVTLTAVLTVVYQVAVDAFLPSLVDRDDLLAANAALTSGEATAESAGFLASGWVARFAGTPFVFAIDAATYVASALCLMQIRTPDSRPRPARRRALVRELRDGFADLARVPDLRAIAVAEVLRGAAFGIFMTSYMLWLMRELDISKEWIGTIAFTGSLGSIAGSAAVQRVCDRLGRSRAQRASLVCAGLAYLLVPLAPDAAWRGIGCLVAHQILGDAFDTTWQITSLSTRQQVARPDALGRIGGALASLASLSQCLAAALCAIAMPWSGPRPLLLAAATLPLLAAAYMGTNGRAAARAAA